MIKSRVPVKRWLLSGFFLFMLACTGISRIYDSMAVPKVKTSETRRKAVETFIEGSGIVKVKEKQIYPVFAGLRIRQVAVVPGREVQEGDILFCYDEESMAEMEEGLREEIAAIDLTISKEQIAQETYSGITQTELARREFELAQEELEEERAAVEEEQKKHVEELNRLSQDYEEGLSRLNDDLWQQQDREWEKTKQELENARSSRDRELRAARRTVEERTEELDRAEGGDEEDYRKLERELLGAKEDLEALQAAWKTQIEAIEAQMELLEDQEERLHAGRTQEQEEKRESYEEAVRREDERMEERQKETKGFERALEKAEWELSVAQEQDRAALLTAEQQKRLSALTIRGMELEKKKKYRQLNRLLELKQTQGTVFAREDGIAAEVELTAGKTASGEEIFSLAVGENQFEAGFDKEEQKLAKGDRIEISIPGTSRKKEAVVERMNLMGDEGVFQADLGDLELVPGSVASYSCIKQTDIFSMVIPLEGLRKDNKGYYCLVARVRPAILGEEFRAERVNVELLYQGSQEAAIEGSIFSGDRVIIGENKTIGEGVRVRPVDRF